MGTTQSNKPDPGTPHKLRWHPQYGDIQRSDCWCTVRAVTPSGLLVQVVGQPTLAVTMEQWGRMVGEGKP